MKNKGGRPPLKPGQPTIRFGICLPEDEAIYLKRLSKLLSLSKSETIRTLLRFWIDYHDDKKHEKEKRCVI